MQKVIADFELQFRTLVKQSKTNRKSPSNEKSAYHTKQRKRKRKRRNSNKSNLANIAHQDFFADFGKDIPKVKRLTIAELEEKRLSLPFIDTIEFVRLQLARRGIHDTQEQKEPETTTFNNNNNNNQTIVEDIGPDDFEMDLSEFSSISARPKPKKRYKSAREKIANMTEEERRDTLNNANNNDDVDVDGTTTTKIRINFSEIVSRARFPIFTDQLSSIRRKPNRGGLDVSIRPIQWLLQLIEEMYDARYAFDCSQLKKQILFKQKQIDSGLNRPPPLNTPTFIYTQLETQLGLRQLIHSTAWDMLYNMEYHCLNIQDWPEVDIFRNSLRELITSEHFLFFLHCRHIIQTEHEITFATRLKMNVTTCQPGRMMATDSIGVTAGTCLLTQHPLITDNKTKNVWLSVLGVRQVIKKILYYDDLTDYMMNVRFGQKLIPTKFWISSNVEPVEIKKKMSTMEKMMNGIIEEEVNKDNINNNNTNSNTNTNSTNTNSDGIVVEVINTIKLLNVLVEEMRNIPKDKQVQFKHGDDSETVVLLAALKETERNKIKIDNMEKRIQNEKIKVMSQANKVLIMERENNIKNRTNLFLAKSQLWKLEGIVNASVLERETLIHKDDAVWDGVVHSEHSEVNQKEEEKINMSNSIPWNYSEDVGEQLQIFQAWIREEHTNYVRKLKVVASIGKTYAQQIEDRKNWAASLLQHNYRKNCAMRIEKEKARIQMEKKKEERRIRREKSKAANLALKKRRDKEASDLKAKMDLKNKLLNDAKQKEEAIKNKRFQNSEGQRRYRKKMKKEMSSRWNRWNLYVKQRRSKNKRLRENCKYIWIRWKGYVVLRRTYHAKNYKATYTIQRMGRAYIAKMSVKIMMRKQQELEDRVKNFMRKMKYGKAHQMLKDWHSMTMKMNRVRQLMNKMGTRMLHLCVVEWREATIFILLNKIQSAKTIQRAYRNREGMVAYMLKKFKNKAAYSIQGAYRAYCARTLLKRARANKNREEECIRKMLYKMKMRRLIASFDEWYEEAYRLRIFAKIMGKGNTKIKEEHWFAWVDMYRIHRPAAVQIQSTWKSFDARVKLTEIFLFARSARKIQNLFRRTLSKMATNKLRTWRDCATTIQARWRSKACQISYYDRVVADLLQAAREKDYLRVEIAFERRRGHICNGEGTTALHVAAQVGSKRILKLCIRKGMDIDTLDLRGRTPLHYLVEGSYPGQEELLEYMLSKGSRRDACDIQGCSVLQHAARLNHSECVISLIAMNANVDQQDIQGFTPLHDAAASNAWSSVKALINMGHCNIDLPDYTGCTALHDTCARGHVSVLKLLLTKTTSLNDQDHEGMTPLHHAVSGIHTECVRLLLSSGCETEIQDHTGMFPLHLTAQDSRRSKILRMLCESFCNLDVVDGDSQTCLHLASIANVSDVVSMLLTFGANPSVRDSVGCQPIHLAARHGSVESCSILFEYNIDINQKNWEGISAIGEARMNNRVQVLQLFDERYVLSRTVERQREETIAGNLGIAASQVKDVPVNWDALKPGAFDESPKWKEILDRSLLYRVVGNWNEYREVLPPKQWILDQRNGQLEEDATYELKHWYENIDTGACTFMVPENIQNGEWIELTEEIQAKIKKEKEKEKEKNVDTSADKDKDDEDSLSNVHVTSDVVAASIGARITTTKWYNTKTKVICIGLPPTSLSVAHARILEPKSIPQSLKADESLSLIDYQTYFKEEKRLLDEMTQRWSSSITIQTEYRGYKARYTLWWLRTTKSSAIQIQRCVRGMISREVLRIQMITLTTTLTLQRRRRGEMCRRYLQIVKPQLQRRRNVVQAALLINRIWRGYYPRRYRRRQWWIQNGPKNNTEWKMLKNNESTIGTFSIGSYIVRTSVLRKYDSYCINNTYDVIFWYSRLRGTFSWETPQSVVQFDTNENKDNRELRLRGFTSEQERVAERLQAIWRGKKMIEQFRIILKAKKIMDSCEDDYMSNPTSLETTCNYMLYVHLFPPHDFERARKLYTKAMEKMAVRGPDHPFILFSFLIYCTATREEDDDVLWELARRAKIADAARNQKRSAFELAEIGFYRMAAVMHPDDAICQMNYAVCLQWLRSDYVQAEEFYMKAARLTLGRDPLIMLNYNWMLKHLMNVNRSGEDALHEESKKLAVVANQEWNQQRAEEQQEELEMENAAAISIQFRFRLRRIGMLKYWPFQMPSYRNVRDRLMAKRNPPPEINTILLINDPNDWEICDDGNGNSYFYNLKTNESKWSRPDFIDDIIVQTLEKGPSWESNHYAKYGQEEPLEDVQDWEAIEVLGKKDSNHNDISTLYYYNIKSGESRWKRPKLIEGQRLEDMVHVLDTSLQDARNWTSDALSLEDRLDWKVIMPEDEGGDPSGAYYYNRKTEQSSYIAPEFLAKEELNNYLNRESDFDFDEVVDDDVDNVDNGVDVGVGVAEVNQTVEIEEGKKSEEGIGGVQYPWSQEWDGEGNLYYYNSQNGESSWELPSPIETIDLQRVEDENEEFVENVYDDWEECDDGNGSTYWYSSSRNESSWEYPYSE